MLFLCLAIPAISNGYEHDTCYGSSQTKISLAGLPNGQMAENPVIKVHPEFLLQAKNNVDADIKRTNGNIMIVIGLACYGLVGYLAYDDQRAYAAANASNQHYYGAINHLLGEVGLGALGAGLIVPGLVLTSKYSKHRRARPVGDK